MCKQVIFLNLNQVNLLKSYNITPSMLSMKVLQESLTSTDYHKIVSLSNSLQAAGNILHELGFESESSDPSDPTLSEGLSEITYPYNHICLNASATKDGSIIIWEESSDRTNPNTMFKRSIKNVVEALCNQMGFEKTKQTKQFKICLNQY